jgi:hypothetical protein
MILAMTDNKTNDYRQRVQEMEAKLNDPSLTDEQTLGDALLSFRPGEH